MWSLHCKSDFPPQAWQCQGSFKTSEIQSHCKKTAFDVQKEPLYVNTSFEALHNKEYLASESGTHTAFTPSIRNETLVNKPISSSKSQIDSAGFFGPTEMAENADAT